MATGLAHRAEVPRARGDVRAADPVTPADPGRARAAELWARVPRAFAEEFRPHAGPLARAIVREVQRAVPEYARPLEGDFGRAFQRGVQSAIEGCLDCVGNPRPSPGTTDIFHQLGKLEFAVGRGLDSLLAAYRAGARVAWLHVSEFCRAAKISAELLCVAAEAIFVFVDEISALSAEGYAAARAEHVGTHQQQRDRLLRLLLAEPAATATALAEVAAAARWPVPARVYAAALEPGPASCGTPRLAEGVLARFDGVRSHLVLGNPDLLRDAELAGWRVAVGPPAPPAEAPASLRWARRTLELADRGVIADAPVLWSSDHLATLWLMSDDFLLDALADRCLEPLRELTDKQRARLAETLLAWLDVRGSAPEIAERLKVHPQTVRYRMHQLENLFGERINDPAERMNLLIALRGRQLRHGVGTGTPSR